MINALIISKIEKIHKDIEEIKREGESLSSRKYTAADISHLQGKLHKIDEKYKEGIIDDRDKQNLNDDPYEHKGQAQIADDLASAHQMLSELLSRTG